LLSLLLDPSIKICFHTYFYFFCFSFFLLFPERSWIEQGCKVGEQIIPLARNFNGVNTDIESQKVPLVLRMLIIGTYPIMENATLIEQGC
jgi:hypothetical protein